MNCAVDWDDTRTEETPNVIPAVMLRKGRSQSMLGWLSLGTRGGRDFDTSDLGFSLL